MKTYNFLCIALILCLFSGIAHATSQKLENTGEISTSKGRLFDLPPKDEIDGFLLDEMDYIYRHCVGNPDMSGHMDCKCHAMAFLEERIKTPSIPKGIVLKAIENQCYSPEKMRGFYFGECMGRNTTKRRATEGTDPVDFCNCYANVFTEELLKVSKIRGLTKKTINKKAENACRK